MLCAYSHEKMNGIAVLHSLHKKSNCMYVHIMVINSERNKRVDIREKETNLIHRKVIYIHGDCLCRVLCMNYILLNR